MAETVSHDLRRRRGREPDVGAPRETVQAATFSGEAPTKKELEDGTSTASTITERSSITSDNFTLDAHDPYDKFAGKKHIELAPQPSEKAHLPPAPQRLPCDTVLELLIFLTAYAARFYKIGHPKAVVFDEFHFGKFVNWTLQQKYYFDIHPPLGKQLLALYGHLVGYEVVPDFMYDKIGEPMGATLFYPLREFSAFVCCLTCVFGYRACRLLGLSPAASAITGFFLALDNLLVVESRLILVDSQLIFFCVLSLYCALVLWRTTKPRTSRRALWLTITGAVAGAAFSIKWTALAYPGVIAIVSFFGLYICETPLTLVECAWAATSGLFVYAASFYAHFKYLIYSGSGDNFMEPGFRHLLLGNAGYDPTLKAPSFLYNFLYLNQRMFISNRGISADHHWSSMWYQWLVNWRGVLYYRREVEDTEPRLSGLVYLLSNPVVTWFALASMITFTALVVVFARYRDGKLGQRFRSTWLPFMFTGTFCLASWLANLLPYILVDRSAFAYHYLPGLFFAEIMSSLIIDFLPKRPRQLATFLLLGALFAAYAFWSPWVYGTPLTEAQHKARRWLPRWT